MTKHYDLARMTTATTGTGTITLGAAASGFLSFAAAGASDGDTVTYAIQDGANSEIGYGVYTAAGTTLTRTVLKSTNANAAISLSGSAQVFITVAAEDLALAGLADVANTSGASANQALVFNGVDTKWEPSSLYLMPPASTGYTTIRLVLTSNGGGNAYSFTHCELYDREGTVLTPASVSAWETYGSLLPTSATAGWSSSDTTGSPCWFDFSFSGGVAPAQILMQAYTDPTNVHQTPVTLTVEGSNDGTAFTEIGTVTFATWTSAETQTVDIVGAPITDNYTLLSDVDGSTPATDGQVLTYSAAGGKWKPGAAGSGSAGYTLTAAEIMTALGVTLPTTAGTYALLYAPGAGWSLGSTSLGGTG